MKIVKWVERENGDWAWMDGDHIVASAGSYDDGMWRARWHGNVSMKGPQPLPRGLGAEFESATDACLAAEKAWPPEGERCEGWFESKKGGYVRKYDRTVFYVRQAKTGWYAVGTDAKVLGRRGSVSYFATAADACNAVHKERHTLVDHDPFAATDDDWCWITIPKDDRK